MTRIFLIVLAVVVVAAAIVASNSMFTVHQTTQAIVLWLGKPQRVLKEPGLEFKAPFVEDVIFYDSRVLDLDPPAVEVQMIDKKRINIDAYLRYRIVDPLLFFQAVRTERNFQDRFIRVTQSAVKRVIGKISLVELLSEDRDNVMAQIRTEVDNEAPSYGVVIIDVRIGRTDLPVVISQNVYDRMRTERDREARELRAQGSEEAKKIRARADREKTVLLADAKRTSDILRGEGEGERNRILAAAYGKDPDFFDFYKSMEQYQKSLVGGTTMVLSPDSDFFRYFGQESPK